MVVFYNINVNKKNLKIKNVLISLFGIGKLRTNKICCTLGIDPNSSIDNLKESDQNKINNIINLKYKYLTDADLRKSIHDNISLLKKNRSYRGIRHIYRLPVNGQRSHTNAKTQKWK